MQLKTLFGQCLGSCIAQPKNINLKSFTMDCYKGNVRYKTSYFSVYTPVLLGILMTGNTIPEMNRQARNILFDMGYFHQVQNDFVDCFGDPKTTRQVGTDIQDGTCTWPAVVAFQKASPKQREIMREHYGSPDPQKASVIKDLYKKLDIPEDYAEFEEEYKNRMKLNIQQLPNNKIRELMFEVWDIFHINLLTIKYH